MERVLQSIKWSLIVLFMLALVWAGLAATKWLPQPTALQSQALAIIDAPPTQAVGKRNAFAAIWLWQYDVPATDLERVASADVARYRIPDLAGREVFISSASGHFPSLASVGGNTDALCVPSDVDCLAKIRHNPAATREVLAANPTLLNHALALSGYDYYHSRFPPNLMEPSPNMSGPPWLQISDAGLRFVEGDKAEGLLRACTAAATWRRLALHDDNLLVQGSAADFYTATSNLVANMLSELPANDLLPAACTTAFATIDDPIQNMCDTMKSQYRARLTIADPFKSSKGSIVHLLSNKNSTAAFLAPGYAQFCSDDAMMKRNAGTMFGRSKWKACGVQGMLFNPMGCQIARIINPERAYSAHITRLRNMHSMNRLLGEVLAQRLRMAATAASANDSERHALPQGISEDTSHLQLRSERLDLQGTPSGQFVVPMPASRWSASKAP